MADGLEARKTIERHGPSEEEQVRGGTPHEPGARSTDRDPVVRGKPDTVNEDGVLPEAAQLAKPFQLPSRACVEPLGEVDEKRRVGRGLTIGSLDVGFPLQKERVGPAVASHHAYREPVAELAIERIVVGYGRDSREEVLQPADEQSIAQRVGTAFADAGIFLSLGRISSIERAAFCTSRGTSCSERVELEAGGLRRLPVPENEGAFEVDYDVGAFGRRVDSENPALQVPDGRSVRPPAATGVDQRVPRAATRRLHLLTARRTTRTGRPSSGGSSMATVSSAAPARALRWSSSEWGW